MAPALKSPFVLADVRRANRRQADVNRRPVPNAAQAASSARWFEGSRAARWFEGCSCS